MTNKANTNDMLQRMKSLMTYGINESKQPEYSTIEHSKVAADGKLYGIVREGANFFIKVAKNPKGQLVTENFDYIGGFRNRKDNMFESFAAASRYFDEKMININESLDRIQKQVIAENYISEKKDVIAEQTEKMQQEIARQRQIMENAQNIMEKKEQNCTLVDGKCKGTEKNSTSPKCDAKDCDAAVDYHGNPIKKTPGAPFNETAKMNESTEAPLCSRENPEYMDKSHGTEIGNNAPFCEPKDKVEGAVADAEGGEAEQGHMDEGVEMHNNQNQNAPAPGTGDKGDQDPFEKTVNESLDDMDDTLDDNTEDADDFDVEDTEDDDMVDEPIDEPVDGENEEPVIDDADIEADIDTENDDLRAEIDELKSKMDQILSALNNMKYNEDEPLYDNDTEGTEDDAENDADIDLEMDTDEPTEEETPENDDDITVKESKSFKAMKARIMNEENRLDDFGKHPAYQKKVMTLPQNQNRKVNGQYDVNDTSVDGEQPYGQQKGDTAPFNVDREKVENEIVENVLRTLKKKLG